MTDYSGYSTKQLKKLLEEKQEELRQEQKVDLEKKAKDLIDTLFTTFKTGGDWLKEIISDARKNIRVFSPLGRARHLWGHMHHDESVHAAMDRRGPNSVVQGTGSDLGFEAARALQRLTWHLFKKHDRPFSLKHMNAVHDSNKTMVHIAELPIALYLIEHSMTTEVHKRCRKVFGFPLKMDLECDFEIGGAQSALEGWDGTADSTEEDLAGEKDESGIGLYPIVQKSMDWMEKELGYEFDRELVMYAVQHNFEIIQKFRKQELKDAANNKIASELRYLTEKNALNQNFIFADDFEKMEKERKGKSKNIKKKTKKVKNTKKKKTNTEELKQAA